MKKYDDFVTKIFKDYNMDKEVACAAQVASVVKKSGIELTGNINLMLMIIQDPVINFIMSAKVAELKFLFGDQIPGFQKSDPGNN